MAAPGGGKPSPPTTEIDLSGFGLEHLQHIGRGAHASAQLVRETATGNTYVAKCISLACLNEHDQDLADQEVLLLQTLSHPYIVAYRDSFLVEGSNTLVIVMEYCDAGDLRKAIKNKLKTGQYFEEDQIMAWFVQLCLALQYIHSERVLHRDLKTSNIFLSDGGNSIKLGDFGISRVLEGTKEAAVTIVGTPYYMSPELCRSEPYNWKSDVWALGCVLYELCMLKHAFESSSLMGLVYKIVSDHYEPIPSHYSPELNNLICQLLDKSADSRPSINELFANPYVKQHLDKVATPVAQPAAPAGRPRLPRQSSMHSGNASPATLSSPPPALGPPQLGPGANVSFLAARIRRRLVGQKLNWISQCASFDDAGDGSLSSDAMVNALTSMTLGLSEAEIQTIIAALATTPAGKVSLDSFSGHLQDVAPDVAASETWARQILASPGRKLREAFFNQDRDQRGTLAPSVFQAALSQVVPVLTPGQLDVLVLLADKNCLGDVDYMEFVNAYGPPMAPQSLPSAAAPVPPGMPPLPGGGAAVPKGMPPLPGGPSFAPAAPPGMPPLPGAQAQAPAGPPSRLDPASTMTMNEINFGHTFFTCTLASIGSVASAGGSRRVTLSAQGVALVFSRMRRRLDAVGLPIGEVLALFTYPGSRELTAEQWLDVASTLPLGTSRAEMQELFSKLDADGSGKVPFSAIEAGFQRASYAECTNVPRWFASALQNNFGGKLCAALQGVSSASVGIPPGAQLVRESDFRRVIMQTERYLSTDQLNSLVLLADKSGDGHLDYVEFASRFGGGAAGLRVLGGVLPMPGPRLPDGGSGASDQEVRTVSARTSALLERQGVSPDRLPALVSLWGAELPNAVAAELLSLLPLGLSRREAELQLQTTGHVHALARKLWDIRAQGVWRAQLEWAGGNIPGPKLRTVLQSQVIEAESRTLEPAEFAKALSGAGIPTASQGVAMWMAEKTSRGDVRIAEFLETFGGQQPTDKKKKLNMFWRMVGR